MKVMIAAGGSGGHLYPAQQLAEEIQKDAEILFVGHGLEKTPFFRKESFPFKSVRAALVVCSPKGFFCFLKETLGGFMQSWRFIREFNPDVIVGFGSFHSLPILLAAVFLRKKIVLFEANSVLGKVNRLFAPFAQFVGVQFHLKSHLRNSQFVPLLPWNKTFHSKDRKAALEKLGLSPDRPTFLIFGGSQGADFLNRTIPSCLPGHLQVIHLAGNQKAADQVQERYSKEGIVAIVKSFEKDMPSIYAASDFAICRSGAGTIAELIHFGIPALLIPFPFATNQHQAMNARFMVEKIGGATMLIENEVNLTSISQAIDHLLCDSNQLKNALDRFRVECSGRQSFSQQIFNALGGKKI